MKAQTWAETETRNPRFPKFRKHEKQQERDWCLAEIEVARNGGHCEPYTPEQWITCMKKRIEILNRDLRS